MVSLIKNQLLKHLSIYTKNLSSDKINLSTFRGEGELSNLQLDEAVLTELLELPSWLRLTSAWCNHVSFRISWTKLKSVPITLTLDEVNITVETCDPTSRSADNKSPNGVGSGGGGSAGGGSLPQAPQGKYSFIHKVVDGITIIVNTVNVKFLSTAFTASVQMSRIRVESKTPKWANGDLRFTRLKDTHRGIILIFKELSWQTVRIEASSTQDKSLTPLRLLTNHARCRITIRKRLSDCTLLASRLVLILDDLLWVLTDSQLKAALHFVDSLSGLIKSATAATQKSKAARKLETLPEYQAQLAQQQNRQSESSHANNQLKMFNAFDVRETSYHFFSQRIDLHLCDDEGDGRSTYPELDKGGALQISVQAFQVDYYPYHLAKSDRSHWAKYKEASVSPALWLKESLNAFREAVLNLSQPNRPSSHAPLERSTPNSPVTLNPSALATQYATSKTTNTSSTGSSTPTQMASNVGSGASSGGSHHSHHTQQQKTILDNLSKLMSSCVILRIEDFQLYRVTTSGKKQMPKEFVSAQHKRKIKPGDLHILVLLSLTTESGKTLSASPPLDSLPGVGEGITKVISICGITQPNIKDFFSKRLIFVSMEALPTLVVEAIEFESPLLPLRLPALLWLQAEAVVPEPECNHNVMGTASTNGMDLWAPRERAPRKSIQTGSSFIHCKEDDLGIEERCPLPTPPLPLFPAASAAVPTSVAATCDKIRSVTMHMSPAAEGNPVPNTKEPSCKECKACAKSARDEPISRILVKAKRDICSLYKDNLDDPFNVVDWEPCDPIVDGEPTAAEFVGDTAAILTTVLGTNMTWPTPPLDQIKSNTFGSVETPSPITNEAPPYDNGIHLSNPNTHGYNVQIQSSSTMASSTTSQTSSTKPDTGVFTQSVTSSISKSYRSTRNSTSDAPSITKEINSGLMSMKKGFSSFMTSIDSAITSRAPNDDMSDTFSIQSDISSDSENFAIVMGDDKTMDCIDVMFRLNPFTNDGTIKASPVEVASEVYEEPIKTNLSSPSEPSEASTWRRRDLVSMVTFRLTTVEVIRQQEGNNSTLRVQVAAIQCDECGAIPWDELQTKFGARCKAWNLAPYNPEAPPCIRLRLEETIKPPKDATHVGDKKVIQNWVSHHADIRVSDISLDLSMSTVIGLADLAEDEVISSNILPLNVTVENVRINLIEDRPPVNITSPGPVPINLAIGRMHLKRDKTGLLHIQPIETNLNGAGIANYPLTAAMLKTPANSQRERERDRELLSLQLIMQQIKMDNDNLRKQLQNAKENSESYRQKSKQETDVLRSYLKAAQDDITILLEEKKALLDTIRSLQCKLNTHDTNARIKGSMFNCL
ncbi:UHRF1-binding protein 1-like [Lucilia cuprina]|uniref:UHRF1-binding protein 1-like n=1 Tax=Lucilia cuprina TaxID=7375 RepID=UPI001F062926|nr:UHRF1-binding protein 1-like [Lucilia cuprina]